MSKTYSGLFRAKIVNYNDRARTARVTIPTVTDGLDEGITATFAYPVGHDDKDTEIEILSGADCYIFFERNDPSSPVIFAYSSHGIGAVVDYRRIRQENIELLARANINIQAGDTIHLKASNIVIEGEVLVKGNTTQQGNNSVSGTSDLQGSTTIEGKSFMGHGHNGVRGGSDNSGGVV